MIHKKGHLRVGGVDFASELPSVLTLNHMTLTTLQSKLNKNRRLKSTKLVSSGVFSVSFLSMWCISILLLPFRLSVAPTSAGSFHDICWSPAGRESTLKAEEVCAAAWEASSQSDIKKLKLPAYLNKKRLPANGRRNTEEQKVCCSGEHVRHFS